MLAVHRDQLRAQRSVTSMGKLYLFLFLYSLRVVTLVFFGSPMPVHDPVFLYLNHLVEHERMSPVCDNVSSQLLHTKIIHSQILYSGAIV